MARRAGSLALLLLYVGASFSACEPPAPAPQIAPTPTELQASPSPPDVLDVTGCRGLEVPSNREVNTSLDRKGGTLDFSYYAPKLQRDRSVTIRYRDDPSCRRNPETRRLIQHVGAAEEIDACVDLPRNPPAGMTRVELWFWDRYDYSGWPKPLVIHRDIPSSRSIARDAVEAWIAGPRGDERKLTLRMGNPDTEVLGLDIDNGVARIELNEAFHATGLGTSSEGQLMYSLVGVLTQFEPVERVILMHEGKELNSWGGHGGMLEPGGETRPGPKWYRTAPVC